MAHISEEAREFFRRCGRQGGKKAWKGVPKAQRTERTRRAARTRWRNRKVNGKSRAK